jgi:hypothetical protein
VDCPHAGALVVHMVYDRVQSRVMWSSSHLSNSRVLQNAYHHIPWDIVNLLLTSTIEIFICFVLHIRVRVPHPGPSLHRRCLHHLAG